MSTTPPQQTAAANPIPDTEPQDDAAVYRISIRPTKDLTDDNANVFTWDVGLYGAKDDEYLDAIARGKAPNREYAIEQARHAIARDQDDDSFYQEDIS